MCGYANCDHRLDEYEESDGCCTNAEHFACFGEDSCCSANLEHGFQVMA